MESSTGLMAIGEWAASLFGLITAERDGYCGQADA